VIPGDEYQKLKSQVQRDVDRRQEAKKEKPTLLAQTVYLGTLGFMLVLPIVVGAYLGSWLDGKLTGYSFSWTISLIFLGLVIGALNVYFFVKE
jgi:ATP synthase protein I